MPREAKVLRGQTHFRTKAAWLQCQILLQRQSPLSNCLTDSYNPSQTTNKTYGSIPRNQDSRANKAQIIATPTLHTLFYAFWNLTDPDDNFQGSPTITEGPEAQSSNVFVCNTRDCHVQLYNLT